VGEGGECASFRVAEGVMGERGRGRGRAPGAPDEMRCGTAGMRFRVGARRVYMAATSGPSPAHAQNVLDLGARRGRDGQRSMVSFRLVASPSLVRSLATFPAPRGPLSIPSFRATPYFVYRRFYAIYLSLSHSSYHSPFVYADIVSYPSPFPIQYDFDFPHVTTSCSRHVTSLCLLLLRPPSPVPVLL
jgi:hypothetical protein